MTYTGNKCSVCNKEFVEGDSIVVCPDCGTPVHRDCWFANGVCINADKHDSGFVWKSELPEPEKVDTANSTQKAITKECPECGANCRQNARICRSCGYRFDDDTAGDFQNAEDFQLGPLHVKRVDMNEVKVDGIPAEEIATYIGASAPAYLAKFIKMDAKKTKVSFNFIAAIFGPLWAFMHGLYKIGILLAAVLLATGCLELTKADITKIDNLYESVIEYTAGNLSQEEMEAAINSYTYDTDSTGGISYARTVIVYSLRAFSIVFAGVLGTYFYRKKMVDDVMKSREEANDMETYKSLLRKKGRIKILPVILFMLFYTAIPVIAYVLMKAILF